MLGGTDPSLSLTDEDHLALELASTAGKKSSMVQIGPGKPAELGVAGVGCFQTPVKRIGNLTISTVRGQSNLQPRTPLGPVGNQGCSSPMRPIGSTRFKEDLHHHNNKENQAPGSARVKAEIGHGRLLVGSPFRPKATAAAKPKPPMAPYPVDWDTLDQIVRSSAIDAKPQDELIDEQQLVYNNNNCVTPAKNPRLHEDHLEELLFSGPPDLEFAASEADVFLGYENADCQSEFGAASLFGFNQTTASLRSGRSRAGSLVGVHKVTPRNAGSKIQVNVRASKKELPTLRNGSQLRRMILPADKSMVKKRRGSVQAEGQDDSEPEYHSFITKLCADEPVESGSDDDFKECDEDDSQDEPVPDPTTIPKREIEFLFEEDYPMIVKYNCAVVSEPKPLEELVAMFKSQIKDHFQLLVQGLGLCSEIQGTESKSIPHIKLLSRLKVILEMSRHGKELMPVGLVNFGVVLQGIPDLNLRTELLRVSKDDPDLRLRSVDVPTPTPPVFKHGSHMDPYCLSQAYYNLLTLFNGQWDPRLAFNMHGLVDNCPVQPNKLYYGKRTDCFLQSEDKLLLVGLKKFGLGNWNLIQAQFLPTRSTKQISIRYKNLAARRAPPNPIKDFVAELYKPLSKSEEELIYRGVQRCGKDFKLISQHFLPHRPPTILRNLWNKMDADRRNPDNPEEPEET